MHPQFLDLLRCPLTGDSLRLVARRSLPNGSIEAGALVTPDGREYPIRAGVPRFVESGGYAESFDFEWERWSRVQYEAENVGRPMEGHTTSMWELATGLAPGPGETVVEFGCGGGRFLDVVRRRGARAVGLELTGAADAAARNFRGDVDVLVVQGDVLSPPFAPGVFDAGYSIGVLHHTPDPARGVAQLAGVVAAGGRIACSVYEQDSFYDFPSVHRLRRAQNALFPRFGYRFALAYAALSANALTPAFALLKRLPPPVRQLAALVERRALPVLHLPDSRWRVLDIFDALTPAIASTHTRDEVLEWLRQAGCEDVRSTPWGDTSAAATVAR